MEKYLMLFTHYLLGYVGKSTWICTWWKKIKVKCDRFFLGTVICSIGLVLALCSVYIFTRRHMVNSRFINIIW